MDALKLNLKKPGVVQQPDRIGKMTIEETVLARKLGGHPAWEWCLGMRGFLHGDPSSPIRIVPLAVEYETPRLGWWCESGQDIIAWAWGQGFHAVPDITDPATVGCMLGGVACKLDSDIGGAADHVNCDSIGLSIPFTRALASAWLALHEATK